MPRKKPLVPKRRHYSRDLKRRVIYQAGVLGRTSTEISFNLDIPLRVVQRVKQTWNEIGEVCKDRTAMGRAPLMQPEHCEVSNHFTCLVVWLWLTCESQFLLALLEHSPDIYLDELQGQLEEQHDIKVSVSTVSNTLKRLGITSKKVSRVSYLLVAQIPWPCPICSYPGLPQNGVRLPGGSLASKSGNIPLNTLCAEMRPLWTFWQRIVRMDGTPGNWELANAVALFVEPGWFLFWCTSLYTNYFLDIQFFPQLR
jgi:transposase